MEAHCSGNFNYPGMTSFGFTNRNNTGLSSDQSVYPPNKYALRNEEIHTENNHRDSLFPNIVVQIPIGSNTQINRKIPPFESINQKQELEYVKCEPIKSELNESQTNIAATKSQILPNNEILNIQDIAQNINTSSLVTARPKASLKTYICDRCPFLSISEANIQKHLKSCHIMGGQCHNLKKINCPGCENIFYSKHSLQSHLSYDHNVDANEIATLIENILAEQKISEQKLHKNGRIYIKDVEVLRDPNIRRTFDEKNSESSSKDECSRFSPLPTGNDDVSISSENDEPTDKQKLSTNEIPPTSQLPRNRIFIKDVKVLRDQSTNDNFDMSRNLLLENQRINTRTDLMAVQSVGSNNQPNIENSIGNIFIKDVEVLRNRDFSNSFANNNFQSTPISNALDASVDSVNVENHHNNMNDLLFLDFINATTKQSQLTNMTPANTVNSDLPKKIFVKNVDNLKTPIMSDDVQLVGVNTFCDRFQNNNDNSALRDNLSIDSKQFSLNKNSKREKIYIKNIDILKEPIVVPPNSFSNVFGPDDDLRFSLLPPTNERTFPIRQTLTNNVQKPSSTQGPIRVKDNLEKCDRLHRNFQSQTDETPRKSSNIHLRTVDELNLMNMNDVQNLITPTLDGGTIGDNITNHLENLSPRLSQSFWSNDGFDGFTDSTGTSPLPPAEVPPLTGTNNFPKIRLNAPKSSSVSKEQIHVISEKDLLIYVEPIVNGDQRMEGISDASVASDNDSTDTDDPVLIDTSVDKRPIMNNDRMEEIVEIDDVASSKDVETGGSDENRCRIYVASNLMEKVTENKTQNSASKMRGRPYGAKQTKIKRLKGDADSAETIFKCDTVNCAIKFKILTNLEYHKRCHVSGTHSQMVCPECKSDDFRSWDTLHTHLWRSHQIDMELYNCNLCNFKTPVLSRLLNTHKKIHSEERNFRCDQCVKTFKNSKQLNNHRRCHRPRMDIHKCGSCSFTFAHAKTLQEHILKEHKESKDDFKCKECGKIMSSKSALKLHTQTHSDSHKFKCTFCPYTANDHNAFRRHKRIHDQTKMYSCSFCDYKCVQSNLYRTHILRNHPEKVDEIILKCPHCNFTTINQAKLEVHAARHDSLTSSVNLTNSQKNVNKQASETNLIESVEIQDQSEAPNTNDQPRKSIKNFVPNQIKVKSNLILRDPNIRVNENLLIAKNFDTNIT